MFEEAQFRRWYPGADPDAFTDGDFYRLLAQIPALIRWEHFDEKLVGDTALEQSKLAMAYREAFNHPLPTFNPFE